MAKPYKNLTPAIRRIYQHLLELSKHKDKVTASDVAIAAGYCYSGEIGTQLMFLYQNGYVKSERQGRIAYLTVLKSLPEE